MLWITIINKLNEFSDDKELHFYKTELTKNVPYKALSGFANKGLKMQLKHIWLSFMCKKMLRQYVIVVMCGMV